jgi:acyl CoA:acetate/3-ketoacid CoA transferase beta subunit
VISAPASTSEWPARDKLVRACDYPLTAARVVSLVITDLGVF